MLIFMHVGICSIYYIAMMQVQQPTTMSKKKKNTYYIYMLYLFRVSNIHEAS